MSHALWYYYGMSIKDTKKEITDRKDEATPRLAIGWIIPVDEKTEDKGEFEIVGWDWPVEEGETVDDIYANPPLGHDEVWPELRESLWLDTYPYEYFPRFRVVANRENSSFSVWGDEKILNNDSWQEMIIKKYNLPEEKTEFFTDGLHYFSANPDSELVWDPVDKEMKLIIDSYDDVREAILSESSVKRIFRGKK